MFFTVLNVKDVHSRGSFSFELQTADFTKA